MVSELLPIDAKGNVIPLEVFMHEITQEVVSNPPDGCKRVTNIYVELVEGNPKLRVEYET